MMIGRENADLGSFQKLLLAATQQILARRNRRGHRNAKCIENFQFFKIRLEL